MVLFILYLSSLCLSCVTIAENDNVLKQQLVPLGLDLAVSLQVRNQSFNHNINFNVFSSIFNIQYFFAYLIRDSKRSMP